MEEFKKSLKNSDTVKVILAGVGETSFSTREIFENIQELERLAKIGRATEKAFMDNEYCIASYKGNHLASYKTIQELLEWAEKYSI